jgi:hypothetical protein
MLYFMPMLGNSWIAIPVHTLLEAIAYRVKRILKQVIKLLVGGHQFLGGLKYKK